ncbi:MAG: flagellar motor switch protein FliN [Lachnospiraceae bacterium]|nr:flagellar motor switch protein FliN [Lachnospiraceae bacterium]
MGANGFNEMEIDAIGEIMNISLGASATAVSTLLGTKVDITTPTVTVQTREEFEFKRLEPAIGVEIAYVEGLDGRNVMMFRREDVRVIVSTLMGTDLSDDSFGLDEIHISAICEIMNQMMGASATALSEFLGFTVNISTPKSFDVGEPEEFKEKYFTDDEGMVVVRFRLEIEEKLNSEFMNIMSTKLAKRLLVPFGLGGDDVTLDDVQLVPNAPAEPEPEPVATEAPASAPSTGGSMSQEEMDALMASMGGGSEPAPQPAPAPVQGQQPYYPPYPQMGMDPMMLQLLNQMQQTQMQMMEMMKMPKATSSEPSGSNSIIKPLSSEQIRDEAGDGFEDKANQEMLMKVPMEVSVEIGRTKRLVRDILEFTQGTLVVLDKMAGEQVDLFVNGKCIARGDIVVVEDNFGIRITEIVTKEINPESL